MFGLNLLVFLLIGCSSADKGADPKSAAGQAGAEAEPPPRPWQKGTLKGVMQTSIEAFGSRMFVRVWPSTANRDPTGALLEAVTEIKRIETMTSPNYASGELFKINEGSWNGAVEISPEMAQILIDCDQMYRISEGKFDITYVPYRGERDFVEDDINKIKNWDAEPKLSKTPKKLIGTQGLLLDTNPTRIRRYNRRHRLNLNGMIRGYTIDRVTQILAPKQLAGFAVISEGLVGAAGIALKDPNLLCIENPERLGTCLKNLTPQMTNRVLYFGTSASLERKGKMFDPKSSWSYRAGGVTIAGSSAKWVQFGLTYGAIADEGRLNTLFEKNRNLGLSGMYFDANNKTQLVGSLMPYLN
jgi:hypothetical protein